MKFYTESMQVNIPFPIYQESVSASKDTESNQASSAEIKLPVNSQSDQVNISEEAVMMKRLKLWSWN